MLSANAPRAFAYLLSLQFATCRTSAHSIHRLQQLQRLGSTDDALEFDVYVAGRKIPPVSEVMKQIADSSANAYHTSLILCPIPKDQQSGTSSRHPNLLWTTLAISAVASFSSAARVSTAAAFCSTGAMGMRDYMGHTGMHILEDIEKPSHEVAALHKELVERKCAEVMFESKTLYVNIHPAKWSFDGELTEEKESIEVDGIGEVKVPGAAKGKVAVLGLADPDKTDGPIELQHAGKISGSDCSDCKTAVDAAIHWASVAAEKGHFEPGSYNLITHNCNSFTVWMLKYWKLDAGSAMRCGKKHKDESEFPKCFAIENADVSTGTDEEGNEKNIIQGNPAVKLAMDAEPDCFESGKQAKACTEKPEFKTAMGLLKLVKT